MSIGVRNLVKRYGDRAAINDISFDVKTGEILGFLGPNGAGKTTTMKIITCYMPPTSGTVDVDGMDVREHSLEVRKKIGYLPEMNPLYFDMNALDSLEFAAELHGLRGNAMQQRVKEMVDVCGLEAVRHKDIGEMSKGYRQRVGLAQAMIHDPDVLILDEPTSGLDPQCMKDVRELVRELGAGGTTVFLSSHLLHEVEQVCNRAVIINKGRVVVEGPVSELHPAHSSVKLLTSDQEKARATVAALVGPQAVVDDEEYLVVEASDGTVREMVKQLVAQGIGVDAVIPAREQGLEDYFLGLTQSSDVDSNRDAAAATSRETSAAKGGAR
jgi:ABC-2 type transport system ATP-binding protein